MHVNVDYAMCEGHGQCLLAAPDVFDLPDDSDTVVVLSADPPEQDRPAVVRAAGSSTGRSASSPTAASRPGTPSLR